MRVTSTIAGLLVSAACATMGGFMLATPAKALCELCSDKPQSSGSTLHLVPISKTTAKYVGPHLTAPLNTPVGSGSGSGGAGDGGNGGDPDGGNGGGNDPDAANQPGPAAPAGNNPLLPMHNGGTDSDQINLLIACSTLDGETDVRFRNIGSAVIPAGSRVRWSVEPTGQHGAILLPREIKVGGAIKAQDLLRDAAGDGFSCRSHLL